MVDVQWARVLLKSWDTGLCPRKFRYGCRAVLLASGEQSSRKGSAFTQCPPTSIGCLILSWQVENVTKISRVIDVLCTAVTVLGVLLMGETCKIGLRDYPMAFSSFRSD